MNFYTQKSSINVGQPWRSGLLKLSLLSTLFFNLGLFTSIAPAGAKETDQLHSKFDTSWVNAAPVGVSGGGGLAIAAEPASTSQTSIVDPMMGASLPAVSLVPVAGPSSVGQRFSDGMAEPIPHRFLEIAQGTPPEPPATVPSTPSSGEPQAPAQSSPDGVEPTTPVPGQPEVTAPSEPMPTQPSAETPQVGNPLTPPPGWRFDFEPYVYLPFKARGDIFFGRGRNRLLPNLPTFPNNPGNITQDTGFTLSVDADLSDILSKLNFGLFGRFQAWNGNFGIVVDALYLNSEFSNRGGGGEITLRDQLNIPVPGFRIDTQNRLTSASLGGSYRLGPISLRSNPNPANPSSYYPAIAFEALAGVRYVSVFQSVDFARGPEFEFSGSELKPLLGGGVNLLFSDTFGVFFRADTALLGDGNLKQYYNFYAGIDWRFSRSWGLRLAYRINEIEFVRGGRFGGDNGFSLRSEGVQLGFSWQF